MCTQIEYDILNTFRPKENWYRPSETKCILSDIQTFKGLVPAYEKDVYVSNAPGLMSLEGLPQELKSLQIYRSGLGTFENLPKKIKFLMIIFSQLDSFKGLTSEHCIDSFICYNNPITSFDGLNGCIYFLDCSNTLLTSLRGITQTIVQLDISDTLITSLEYLPPALKTLNCQNTLITSLCNLPEGLSMLKISPRLTSTKGLPSTLKWFNCTLNPGVHTLENLPTSLLVLKCYGCSIKKLPSLKESRLVKLGCDTVDFDELPETLKELELHRFCTLKKPPPRLESLIFYTEFSQEISSYSWLPGCLRLKNLIFQGHRCTVKKEELLRIIPYSLEKLSLSKSFDNTQLESIHLENKIRRWKEAKTLLSRTFFKRFIKKAMK